MFSSQKTDAGSNGSSDHHKKQRNGHSDRGSNVSSTAQGDKRATTHNEYIVTDDWVEFFKGFDECSLKDPEQKALVDKYKGAHPGQKFVEDEFRKLEPLMFERVTEGPEGFLKFLDGDRSSNTPKASKWLPKRFSGDSGSSAPKKK